jgi:RNA 2',3'-cyclic 3'-phosphodiesterase
MPGKTHHTAVAIVPPEEVWEPIQAIRRRYDRQIHRWMPHVNLLYPFRPQADFPTATPTLVDVCASLAPLTLTLGAFRSFRHGSGRCTLWLAPEPAEELRRLQATLQAAFPDCDDRGRFPAGFTPHLSVGQFTSSRDGERVREQLQVNWQPIAFTLTEVALLARGEDSPFVIERRIPFADSKWRVKRHER